MGDETQPHRRLSGASQTFSQVASDLASRCRLCATMKTSGEGPFDIPGARRSSEYALELEGLAERIDGWATMPAICVELERPVIEARILTLQRLCEDLFDTLPKRRP